MHRQSPLTAGFMGYTSGGARTLIDTIDDGKLMQQMKGSMLHGEAREQIESPQNYGFSSVVRAATKGKDGSIDDCAEGFMSFNGAARGASFCAVMDDRRFRPLHLKEGENSQYDDLGQMTLLRRTGMYILSLDSPDDSQKSGDGAGGKDASGGGGGQDVERMASLRHVNKSKQERPSRGGGDQSSGGGGGGGTAGASGRMLLPGEYASGSDQQSKDHKHEGESVNHEVRVTKKRIEFRSGDDVVGYYDKEAGRWSFTGEIKLGSDDADHPVYGVNGGVGMTTETSGAGAVLVKAPKPGPPTSLDGMPFEALLIYLHMQRNEEVKNANMNLYERVAQIIDAEAERLIKKIAIKEARP